MLKLSDIHKEVRKELFAEAKSVSSEKSSPTLELSMKPVTAVIAPKSDLLDIFKFLSTQEKMLALVGILFSSLQGAVFPAIFLYVNSKSFDILWGYKSVSVFVEKLGGVAPMAYGIIAFTIVSILACYSLQTLSVRVSHRLKNLFFQSIVLKKLEWFDRTDPGALTAGYCQHLVNISIAFSSKLYFVFFFLGQIVIVLALVGVIQQSIVFCGVLVLVTGLVILPLVLSGRKNGAFQTRITQLRSTAGAALSQAFGYFKPIKALVAEEHELRKFGDKSADILKDCRRHISEVTGYLFISMLILHLLANLLYGGLFLIKSLGIRSPFNGEPIDPHQAVILIAMLLPPLSLLNLLDPILRVIEKGKVSVAEVQQIIHEAGSAEISSVGRKDPIQGHIRFENVTFSYPTNPDKKVLENVTFEVKLGQKVGIVGISGCGKTTLLLLLQRFYEPQEGVISIDGINIREFELGHLRASIGQLSQNPVFFSLPLIDNLTIGAGNIPEGEVLAVLERLQMRQVCEQLPQGLQTNVTKGAGCFSAGQRQKLSIARMIIRNPPVFMFDEATGVLDKSEQKEVHRLITQTCANKTSIFIAHKLETIIDADLILVMSEGKIVEQGTHADLLKIDKGYYQQLNEIERVNDLCENQEELEVSATSSAYGRQNDVVSEHPTKEMASIVPKVTINKLIVDLILGHKVIYALLLIPFVVSTLSLIHKAISARINLAMFGYILARPDRAEIIGALWGSEQGLLHYIQVYMLINTAYCLFQSVVCTKLQTYTEVICEDFLHKLRLLFSRKMLYKDASFHDKSENNSSALAQMLMIESLQLKDFLINGVVRMMRIVFETVLLVLIATRVSMVMAIAYAVAFALTIGFGYLEARMIQSMTAHNRQINVTLLDETVKDLRTVKSLVAETEIFAKFELESRQEARKLKWFPLYSGFVFGVNQLLYYWIFIGTFLLASFDITYFHRDTKSVWCLQLCFLFMTTFRMTSDTILSIVGGLEGLTKLIEKVSAESQIESDPLELAAVDAKSVFKPKIKGKIEFKNVIFRYPGRNRNAINGLSFVVQPGQHVAFFGRSGAGKTTLVELLLRLYDPLHGEILIDDIDIRNFNLAYLRSVFGTFVQNPAILQGTLKYNIQYNARVGDEAVDRALDQARLTRFVNANPDGLLRQLRSNGDNLSGGQKQRISVARTLARPATVYLFDEATSALDKTNEGEIMDNLDKHAQDKTFMLLSTRSTFMKDSTNVFVLERGTLVEQGSLDALMAKKGFLYKFSK